MTLAQALAYASKKLREAGVENSRFDACCMLESITGADRTAVMLGSGELSEKDLSSLDNAVSRRISGEPLQYILGKWEFMGIDFFVGDGVLIPRPETEILVELALERLKAYNSPIVFDLCAGSGCIGLSIAKLCPNSTVYLFEKYPAAFRYLQKNREALKLNNAVPVMYDITAGFDKEGLPFPDIIVTNPPYIKSSDMSTLSAEVLCEPATALDGGDEGLDFYIDIAQKWQPYIKPHGSLLTECDPWQTVTLVKLFLPSSLRAGIAQDLNGDARVVFADIY